MKMRKVLGILMIIFGSLLALGIIQSLFKFFTLPKSNSDEMGYAFGFLLGQVLIAGVVFLLIRYGLKNQMGTKNRLPFEKG
jgi:nitrate reductase gamma subunit